MPKSKLQKFIDLEENEDKKKLLMKLLKSSKPTPVKRKKEVVKPKPVVNFEQDIDDEDEREDTRENRSVAVNKKEPVKMASVPKPQPMVRRLNIYDII